MELARAARREALRDIQPRPERRASPFPGMPDLPAPFFPRESTFGDLFAHLSRCVRQTILLEARLAAGAYDHPDPAPDRAPRAETASPAESPPQPHRRAEDRPRLRPEQLEDESRADAGRPPEEIIAGICAELGAALDSGLTPRPPAPETDRRATPARQSHHLPPEAPPPSQAERAMHLALQQGIPPPKPPR